MNAKTPQQHNNTTQAHKGGRYKMRFLYFAVQLKKRGATMADIYRLDHEGRESADDAHRDMWSAGEMPECLTENDFRSFCVHIGREFVLGNLDNGSGLFEIHQ